MGGKTFPMRGTKRMSEQRREAGERERAAAAVMECDRMRNTQQLLAHRESRGTAYVQEQNGSSSPAAPN